MSTLSRYGLYLPQPMRNALFVGDCSGILENLPHHFLLLDGDIENLSIPKRAHVTTFNPAQHSLDPLHKINYDAATQFAEIVNAVFPEGETTLTRQRSTIYLIEALLSNRQSLQTLFPTGERFEDARLKIQRLLLSPTLKRVLTNSTNFSLDGVVIARLGHLPPFDRLFLGLHLIANYKEQVVVPDGAFYLRPFHTPLIEQNRLIAGLHYLDETPLKRHLLLIKDKRGHHCTAEDAEILAGYSGFRRDSNNYKDFIERSIA